MKKVKFEIERKYETNPDDFSVTDSKREREREGERGKGRQCLIHYSTDCVTVVRITISFSSQLMLSSVFWILRRQSPSHP